MRKITLLLAMACLMVNHSFSQDDLQLTKKDSIVISSYMTSLGLNIVDDSGDMFNELFKAGDEWNMVSFPSRISIGKYFKSGIGLEAIGTYNKYEVGKIIDGEVNTQETNYYGFDSRLSYDLNKLIGETAWFDPYVGVGLGYTEANNVSRGTYNGVVGFRTWFSDHWALDFNSSGKWAMGDKGASNHIQHAAGVVYQFDIEKGLSKKGKEKLAQILALEKEKQRVQDSIATANRLKEEALLAERLAKEMEQARLAAIEKERIDAENSRKAQIEKRISDLGNIYFALNSSYLNKESKALLDSLVELLENESGIALRVTSHTDSRGSSKYNDWLSEKRVNRTLNYLISKGVARERLSGEGLGERVLFNECDDTTFCTEDKHRLNRRSEFIVIN